MSPKKPLEIARRWAAQRPYRWAIFAGLALAATWTALGQVGGLNDFRDSHLLHSYEVAAVRTILEYGQAPLWNPWSCGGMYASGNPQTRFASPTVLVSLLFGARRAEAVLAFMFLFLGLEGTFQFLRQRTGSALGPLLAAPVFALNGFFAVSWTLGWAYFYGFALLPWILLGINQWTRGRPSGLPLIVGGFAIMIGFGGTYAVPLTGLFALVETGRGLFRLRTFGSRKHALLRLSTAALLTVAACAFRLWPILETMHTSPRVMAGAPRNALQTLGTMLFELPSMGGGQFFIGPAILVLVLSACLSRRALFPAVVVFLCGWLAIGYTSPSLFSLLRVIPIFNLLRYPERLLVPGSLYVAELAALGFHAVLLRSSGKLGSRIAVGALATVAVVGALSQAYAFNVEASKASLVETRPILDQPFAQARGNRWSQGHFLELNRGSIACGEGYPVRMSRALRGDRGAEEFLEDTRLGTARRAAWSPNRIEVDVKATAPTYLVVNQNWHPGWRANHGEVVSRDGLLAVKVAAGARRIVLRFFPRSAIGGAIVSTLAIAIAVWLARRGQTMAREHALLFAGAVAPLLVWGLIGAAWREEVPEPILTNPDGSPILVESPPADARPVNGRFDLPIRLEAARVLPADSDGFVTAELYWRVSGPLPRSLGIFVHFNGPGYKNADHEVIAGTYFLSKAPKQTLLRDSVTVHIDPRAGAGQWTMQVGLWHASGDESRVPVYAADGTRMEGDRLEAARFDVGPLGDEL